MVTSYGNSSYNILLPCPLRFLCIPLGWPDWDNFIFPQCIPKCKPWSVKICWTNQLTNPILSSFKIILLELFSAFILERGSTTSHVCPASFFPSILSLICSAHIIVGLTLLSSKGNNGNRNNFVPALREEWQGCPGRQRHKQAMGNVYTTVPPAGWAERAGPSPHLQGHGGLPRPSTA